jgi:hypothetical protein
MSQFGLEVRDEVILSFSRSRFEEEVTDVETTIMRPLEGDLIYFPLNKKLFEITYTDNKPFFYQFGELQMYDCTCQLFEYSMEEFDTGLEEIDSIQDRYSQESYDYAILAHDGSVLVSEDGKRLIVSHHLQENIDEFDPTVENKEIEEESNRDATDPDDSLLVWDEINPFTNSPDGKY